MDENGWPRPGPGMVAVFALIGLIGGALAGLLAPSGAQRGSQSAAGDQTTTAPTTTVAGLPASFYTVILASIPGSEGRQVAEARADTYRNAGIENVGVLDSSRYGSLSDSYWVVYSGVFPSLKDAETQRDQIHGAHPDLNCYAKQVTDQS
jgi:hypothetical protein